ncbi:MAG TPA: hypothetical protein VHG90_12395 [Acidimicrobiales bacterium]|nr:hypothetical protein [Acidimicrobiales bacterium]
MPALVALLVIALVLGLVGALVKTVLWLLFVGILLAVIALLGFGYKLGRGRR